MGFEVPLVVSRPGRKGAFCAVLVCFALGGGMVPSAGAAPVYPSQQEVDDARAAAAGTAAQVGSIEARLAGASARLERLEVAAAVAAEDYNAAVVVLEEKTAAATAARKAADTARDEVETARVQVGRLAAGTYRGGGELSGLEPFLSADGPQDLLDRTAAMDVIAERRQQAYQRMEAAQLVAGLLDEQAQVARAEQQEAARAAEEARAAARRKADSAAAEVASVEATRSDLIAQLAVLRQTSVELEAQRQHGLEIERREREEAAARAEAERREAAARAAQDEADRRAAQEQASRARAAREAAASAAASARAAAPAAAPAPVQPRRSDPEPPAAPAPPPPPPSSGASASAGQAAVNWAAAQIGKDYHWGATGPNTFDCSGLTSQAWLNGGGKWITRTSRSQYAAVDKIPYSELRPGDLVFYGSGGTSSIHHVAIYAGDGMVIEAPRAGLQVRMVPLRMSGAMPYAGRP